MIEKEMTNEDIRDITGLQGIGSGDYFSKTLLDSVRKDITNKHRPGGITVSQIAQSGEQIDIFTFNGKKILSIEIGFIAAAAHTLQSGKVYLLKWRKLVNVTPCFAFNLLDRSYSLLRNYFYRPTATVMASWISRFSPFTCTLSRINIR